MADNPKLGKSTHPYDTGVGEMATEENAEDEIHLRVPSHQTERSMSPRERTTQIPSQLRETRRIKSAPGFQQDQALPVTIHEGNGSGFSPDSGAKDSPPSQHRIKFGGILSPNRQQVKTPNTSPSEIPSASSTQYSADPNVEVEIRRRPWWLFKKRNARHRRDRAISNEEQGDDLAALISLQSTQRNTNNRLVGRYSKGSKTKNMRNTGSSRRKSAKGDEKRYQILGNKLENVSRRASFSPADRTGEDLTTKSGSKQPKGHQKRLSSSQANPSTTGTNSTPGTTTVHKDFVHEDWRETSSPITPTQALRLLLGSGRSPPSPLATQLDLGNAEATESASTVHLKRPRRDSRASEHKCRTWISFWGSPRQQSVPLSQGPVDNESRQEDDPESTYQKSSKERMLRRRWRSG
ncbi:hypothetical protein GGR54DRAFT_394800 [Hypoxylon sp. NC1633]|nr:hypothetical protein GGR54DRAFT_394800 [Hypoxylon sp. NC1633]